MLELVVSKKYLRRKLFIITALITLLYHWYHNPADKKLKSYKRISTVQIPLKHRIIPKPLPEYERLPLCDISQSKDISNDVYVSNSVIVDYYENIKNYKPNIYIPKLSEKQKKYKTKETLLNLIKAAEMLKKVKESGIVKDIQTEGIHKYLNMRLKLVRFIWMNLERTLNNCKDVTNVEETISKILDNKWILMAKATTMGFGYVGRLVYNKCEDACKYMFNEKTRSIAYNIATGTYTKIKEGGQYMINEGPGIVKSAGTSIVQYAKKTPETMKYLLGYGKETGWKDVMISVGTTMYNWLPKWRNREYKITEYELRSMKMEKNTDNEINFGNNDFLFKQKGNELQIYVKGAGKLTMPNSTWKELASKLIEMKKQVERTSTSNQSSTSIQREGLVNDDSKSINKNEGTSYFSYVKYVLCWPYIVYVYIKDGIVQRIGTSKVKVDGMPNENNRRQGSSVTIEEVQ